MNKACLDKIGGELTSKANNLTLYLSTQLQQINYPQQEDKVNDNTKASGTTLQKCCIGVGALLFVVGLTTKTHIATIGGGIVAIAGLYGLSRNNKQTVASVENVDFTAFTLKVYQQMEDIHTYVFNEWNEFLGKLKDELKQQIQMSDLDAGKKNKAIDLALNRSVINFSMPDVLTDLSNIEKEHDIEKYKTYGTTFKQKYTDAIKSALSEQIERYNEIAKLLN